MTKRIRHKLILYFLLIGTVPLSIALWMEYKVVVNSVEEDAYNHLKSVREIKKTAIEDYFFQLKEEVNFLGKSRMITDAMANFNMHFHNINENVINKEFTKGVRHYYNDIYLTQLSEFKKEEKEKLFYDIYPTNHKTLFFQYNYISNWGVIKEQFPYKSVHDYFHPDISRSIEYFGFDDLYLIDPHTGYIVYSAAKKVDYATSLTKGPFEKSSLGKIFKIVLNNPAGQSIQYYDFEQYLPSFNAPVAFMGTQIIKDGKLIGVLVVQIPIDKINGVMAGDGNWQQAGMGDSGESYLVGSDMKMRSDSRFIIENRAAIFSEDADEVDLQKQVSSMTSPQHTSVLYQQVNSEAVKEALAGNTGVISTTNYLGKKVLSCYTPIQTEDLHWALISEMEEGEVFDLVSGLKYRLLGLILIISIIVTACALVIAYRIASPILQLAKGSKKLATGDFNIQLEVKSDDEIGYLTKMFNMMAISLEEKKNDILRKNAALEQQKEEIEAQRDDIEIRTNQLAKAYKDIRGSINYAQRIQKAKLPQFENLQKLIPDSFIFFKPRDLVSGDFYWFSEIGNKIIIAAVDCTGHGVPGAFMSLIGSGLLDEIVNQKKILKPELILKKMHEGVQQVLRQRETENRDGMDMSLCVIDRNLHKMEFAGAKNPLVYIQNGELHHIKGDKHPIGGLQKEDERVFGKHEIDLEQETTFYIFSDGYQDQFGGSHNRKFMIKNLKELFLKIHHSPIKTQHLILEEKINSWMGDDHKQLDDILIIGFRIDPEKFFPTKINLKDYVKSNLMH